MYIFKTQKTTLFTLNVTFRYQLYQTYILYICIYIYIYIYRCFFNECIAILMIFLCSLRVFCATK